MLHVSMIEENLAFGLRAEKAHGALESGVCLLLSVLGSNQASGMKSALQVPAETEQDRCSQAPLSTGGCREEGADRPLRIAHQQEDTAVRG